MIMLTLLAQQQAPPPPPEIKQFSFWLGEWKCEGVLTGPPETKTKGTNRVTLELKGRVIHEHFSMPGLNGESWSVYTPAAKKWRQTWVDDSGAYIALQGQWEDGKMTLTTLPIPSKPDVFSRMIYSNITNKSFDWDWESSADGGKTWKLAWHLHYVRR